MALSLFRFLGAIGRTEVISNSIGTFTLLIVFTLGGFIIAKGKADDPLLRKKVKKKKNNNTFFLSYEIVM